MNLYELEKLAQASQTDPPSWFDAGELAILSVSDAAFIAAASPKTVLALIEVARAARLALEGANKLHWDAFNASIKKLESL